MFLSKTRLLLRTVSVHTLCRPGPGPGQQQDIAGGPRFEYRLAGDASRAVRMVGSALLVPRALPVRTRA